MSNGRLDMLRKKQWREYMNSSLSDKQVSYLQPITQEQTVEISVSYFTMQQTKSYIPFEFFKI